MTGGLRVDALTVDFGGVRAVDDVTFTVEPAEVVGLIGPNGAGKTTVVDAVSGFTPITAGTVHLGDTELTAMAPHQRARAGLGRTFQSLELFADLTVAENLAVAAPGGPADTSPAVASVLETLGLSPCAQRLPTTLSNGERHLVALARALMAQPQVVCLDEPAAGLDANETSALAAVVRATATAGTGVLLIDHDVDLVLGTCDRVVVLDFGRVIAVGTPTEVRTDPDVVAAYLGTDPTSPRHHDTLQPGEQQPGAQQPGEQQPGAPTSSPPASADTPPGDGRP